ncbi:hypothetical protein [Streptomyces sp. NRRL S-87]|uniref:hypothetical protein n=1 Tax=Streptomyces sp. NRRL S-87 TaxID=1463920 RepID=UPI0004C1C726|nr:hypothetical protein [Streptomyces sp. NRRL S-87]
MRTAIRRTAARRSAVRRTAVAVTVASLALVVTACGSSGTSTDEKAEAGTGKAAASSAPAEPAARPLSAAELEQLAVAQADLPGYKVEDKLKNPPAEAGKAVSDKPACQPYADAIAGVIGKPAAKALRSAVALPKDAGTAQTPEQKALAGLNALKSPATRVILASYEGDKAAEHVLTLKNSGADCMQGFTVTQDGEKTKIKSMTPMTLDAGDEDSSWSFVMDMDGQPAEFNIALMSKGTTLASFYTFSLGGSVKELPEPIIDAQEKKLA